MKLNNLKDLQENKKLHQVKLSESKERQILIVAEIIIKIIAVSELYSDTTLYVYVFVPLKNLNNNLHVPKIHMNDSLIKPVRPPQKSHPETVETTTKPEH